MSQKNETPVLVLSLLITLTLLGAGAWWFIANLMPSRLNPGVTGGTSSTAIAPSSETANPQISVQERLSLGERSLVPGAVSSQKAEGISAIASGNTSEAVAALESALNAYRNDPEALIYLNNARIGEQPSYTIAVSAPLGTSVDPALEILRGVAQAQDELNRAGGIDGVLLKVMIANDDDNEAIAQQVASALVDNSDILGVVGHFSSGVSLAVTPIYDQGELVMISPTSTSVALSGASPFVFRTVPSDRFAASGLARYMLNTLQKQNAAIFYNANSDYSESLKDAFTTTVYGDGGQIVAEFDLTSPTFNALESVEQAINQGAEVLMLAANTPTLDQALQVIAVNRQRLDLLGGDSLYNPKTLQVGGNLAVDMVVAVPWHVAADVESDFPQTSRQLWGGDVSWRTAMAYDATQALIAAIRQAHESSSGQNLTRGAVQQALRSDAFSASGATGDIQLLPSGDRNRAPQLVTVEAGNQSGFGFDFVPIP